MNTISPLAHIIDKYTQKFTQYALKNSPQNNNVTFSPLSSWLLLSIIVSNHKNKYTQEEITHIEHILGCSIDETVAHTQTIFEQTNSDVKIAASIWNENFEDPTIEGWIQNIIEQNIAESFGPPNQNLMNTWVLEKTLGIIKEIPTQIDDTIKLYLMTVVATKITWNKPFTTTDNMMETYNVKKVLKSYSHEHKQGLINHEEKFYGAHINTSTNGELGVLSLIGEESTTEKELLTLSTKIIEQFSTHGSINFYEVNSETPDGNFWFIHEETKKVSNTIPPIRYISHIPAWEAETLLPLYEKNEQGFPEAVEPIIKDDKDIEAEVIQVTKTKFDTYGFESASVSSLMFFATAAMPQMVERKNFTVTMNFNKPYLVVAFTLTPKRKNNSNPIWNGLPVSYSIVKEAMEPEEQNNR